MERNRHSVHDLQYHVVFVPKCRKAIFTDPVKGRVETILRFYARSAGARVLQVAVMPDHVHLIVRIPPQFCVATVIGQVKERSAKRFRMEPLLQPIVPATGPVWARGYCVVSFGADHKIVERYVNNQK